VSDRQSHKLLKETLSRRDTPLHSHRCAARCKIVGFSHEGSELTSRPDPYVVAGDEDSARVYNSGAVKTHVTLVHADRNTPGFMRSPPVVPYIYALESAIDELAIRLALDPIELRRRNDSMTDSIGKPWSSRSLMRCYDEASRVAPTEEGRGMASPSCSMRRPMRLMRGRASAHAMR
jgi:CO/xanthine dehydrogenase Mo-binding subunit